MTENKRYNIKPSKIIEGGFCIQDDRREHSFPTIDDKSNLIMYEKALNEQDNEIQKIYSTLDNRIKKLQEDLEKLNDLDKTEDLHPQAVEDVAIVLSISLNALKEFKKELMGDTE